MTYTKLGKYRRFAFTVTFSLVGSFLTKPGLFEKSELLFLTFDERVPNRDLPDVLMRRVRLLW